MMIYEGDDHTNAEFIRGCMKSLGHDLPNHWTDEDVVEFFNYVSHSDRVATDMEKADMKYQAQIMEGEEWER